MQQFISRFQDRIQGVVSGFDRVLFRGTLRNLGFAYGMEVYLYLNGILFKDYESHVKRISRRVKESFHGSVSGAESSRCLPSPGRYEQRRDGQTDRLASEKSQRAMSAFSAPARWCPPAGMRARVW